jgi:hypothetical protein
VNASLDYNLCDAIQLLKRCQPLRYIMYLSLNAENATI